LQDTSKLEWSDYILFASESQQTIQADAIRQLEFFALLYSVQKPGLWAVDEGFWDFNSFKTCSGFGSWEDLRRPWICACSTKKNGPVLGIKIGKEKTCSFLTNRNFVKFAAKKKMFFFCSVDIEDSSIENLEGMDVQQMWYHAARSGLGDLDVLDLASYSYGHGYQL